MSELSVGTLSQFASSMQVPCSTVVSLTKVIWTYFTLYVKVNILRWNTFMVLCCSSPSCFSHQQMMRASEFSGYSGDGTADCE